MKVFVVIKAIGKTRGFNKLEVEVEDKDIENVPALISFFVNREIERYEANEFKVLSQEDINQMVDSGKVSFGFKYREHDRVDRNEAVAIALQAFVDELFVMFINDEQVERLEDKLIINDGDEISFVRLTMLSGRYF
ncbi:hypothetical protein SH1V18_02650 [Vallitalea longa]|uniref:Uncharacterized protein n=1 Tax=Vallitalea longa TaxID=2936439 RepID=A0A9W5Y8A7_9FIRM|nr:hypothetical protein [Vallitalea longa]GKX27785.1 hypothetical protein SH1V18_02650 [Vallitalea longa]